MNSLFLSAWGRCFSSHLYKILGYRGKVVQARPQWGVPLIRMQKVSVSVGSPSVEVSYGCFAHNRCSVNTLLFLCSGLLWCQRVEFPFPEPCELGGGCSCRASSCFLLWLSIQFLHQSNEGIGLIPKTEYQGPGMCWVWAGAGFTDTLPSSGESGI